ncbi:DNA/RNA helicase, superfamily II [Thermanaerovibrio velox DSM 12556]|uniref:DNA/RNA helicase, superfamily II n=1 Tax=Thermanaerovibrio velox DSM 12556 TaxID=926567 RepID=H0UNK5_9BACT|nr:DEAD/DEAH box helicase [Thermanaerovibrio velox]EHM10420.1 DNA/RNA helicase, superfamily II [Thermanaerovibrio velox DSM 12556]
MTIERFDQYPLRDELLSALRRKGFDHPMPVQVRMLEDPTLSDGDLIVQAKTGSGKTLAFALPLLNQMNAGERTPRVLVLSPTRELALQTAREFQWLGYEMRIKVASLVGGMDMERQVKALRDGAAVVVGTPGRVLDHIRRGSFKADTIQSLVLDEGDHMLDLGFKDELEAIIEAMPGVERNWLFSATMPEEVVTLAKQYLDAPRKISLVDDAAKHDDIVQRAYIIPARKRFEGLANVLLFERPRRAIVFCATKLQTQELAERLCDEGFKAGALHGDMTQRERNMALESLRRGRNQIMVATDVAARGLDISGVSHVIQFGLPGCLETFIHRSGRTGRAGQEGRNLILLTAREAGEFRSMIRGTSLEVEWLPAPDAEEVESLSKAELERWCVSNPAETEEYLEWAEEILQRDDAAEIVAGLLSRSFADEPKGYSIREDVQMEMAKGRSSDRPRRASDRPLKKLISGAVTMKFPSGRQDGWEVGSLLGALCRGLGVKREDVGNIKLKDRCAFVELSPYAASQIERRRDRLAREGLNDFTRFEQDFQPAPRDRKRSFPHRSRS